MTTPAAVKEQVIAYMLDLPHPDEHVDGECRCAFSDHDIARAYEAGMVRGRIGGIAWATQQVQIDNRVIEAVSWRVQARFEVELARLRGGPDGR